MDSKPKGLLQAGVSVALVGTLMVPSTAAFAQPGDKAAADIAAQWIDAAQQEGSAASATGADSDAAGAAGAVPDGAADASTDGTVSGQVSADNSNNTVADPSINLPDGEIFGQPESKDDDSADDAADPNRRVTIIVQLEEGGSQGVMPFSSLLGRASQDRHSYLKNQIRDLALEATGQNSGAQLFGLDDSEARDNAIDELHDYYNVIDGFAIKVPASTLDAIKALDGVKNAFVEQRYDVPTVQAEGAPLKNQASLDITQADEVSQKGDGQVIAVIDTGLDTDHEAFSGDLDDGTVALTQDSVKEAEGHMASGGQGGAYVSEKIPFAYDYADGDNDVNPGISGLEHGTHVAGIASANGGDQIRGTAPNAQLAIMKVASDADGGIYDSAILAAMDDLPALGIDSVNISIGSDAGFSDEGEKTYSDAIDKLQGDGITVNVAQGNSYSSAYKNQSGKDLPYATDPDSSMASSPATVSSALAVASMNTDKVEVEKPQASYITAADGTKMQYVEMQAPNDSVAKAPSFADVEDGTYDVIYGGIGRDDDNDPTSGYTSDGRTYADENGDVENGQDLTGKVVLVNGKAEWIYGIQVEYSRAVNYYKAMGAAAVIIYNEGVDALPDSMKYDGDDNSVEYYKAGVCPAIFVSKADGEALRAAAEAGAGKTTSIAKGAAEESSALPFVVAADGAKVAYKDVLNADGSQPAYKFSGMADGDYDYVWCGIARAVGDDGGNDYDGDINGDWSKLKDKIALVQGNRWFMFEDNIYSYDQMVNQCISAGAKAVIVFDDRYSEPSDVKFSGDGWLESSTVPVIQVGYDQGQALRDAATKTITVKQGQTTGGDNTPETDSYYSMSSFSSWGVTPDLKLKPEIAAPGGNVYSSVLNNQYAYYSGTSMATPQITGIAALMHEYVSSDGKFANMSDSDKADVVSQLLMSTAVPMVRPLDPSSYYSPRQQGAGVANVPAAMSSDVYLTVDGAENPARPKADVGESADGAWSFTVTLHNLGSSDHSYTPDAAALSDAADDGLFQQQVSNWAGKGIDVTYSGDAYDTGSGQVTVPANGVANLTVTVAAGGAFKSFASENTPNGTFVDGFALLKAADGGVDLSVPYMGFYGDWSRAPVYDASLDEDYHIYGTHFVDSHGSTLGVNPMAESDDQKTFDRNKVVVSNSGFDGAPTVLTTKTGLLRNVDNLTFSMLNPDGTDAGSVSHDYVKKSYYHQNAKTYVAAEDLMQQNAGYFVPSNDETAQEGVYQFNDTATTSGPTPQQQKQSFDVIYDKTAPQITDVVYDDNGGDPTVTVTAKDNYYLASIDFVANDEKGITPYSKFYRVLVDDSNLVGEDDAGNNLYRVTVKVSDMENAWPSRYGSDKPITSTVRAYAWDYGELVSNDATAVVVPTPATQVTLSDANVSLSPGQQQQLTATLAPEDTTQTALTWSSSNDEVATVGADGTVTGVAEGEADIAVTVRDNPSVAATAHVKVANVTADEGIELSNATLRTVKDGSPSQIAALLSDDLKGAQVTWSTSNDQVFTVAANADDPAQATLTGGYQVGDATLTATVTTADGSQKQATATIQNRTADYDDFIIDENHVLQGYKGQKTAIVIPNDVTAIVDEAFRGDIQLNQVGIPASVRTIGERAFAVITNTSDSGSSSMGSGKRFSFEDTAEHPSQLTTIGEAAFENGGAAGDITLPSSVTTLGKGAFSRCLSLGAVTLPDSVRAISEGAFQGSGASVVTMSDNVTSIGDNAFNGCLFFTEIKLTNAAEGAPTDGLPSKLEYLGGGSFAGTYLGATGATEFTVPGTVKTIGEGAFSGDRFITGITLADGVEEIGYSAFAGTSLTKFTMPDSVKKVGDRIFSEMQQLQEVTISRNLEAGDLANSFYWNFALTKVTVPDDAANYVTKDGVVYSKDLSELVYYPAGMSESAKTFAVPDGVSVIKSGAFDSSKLSDITFPASLQAVENGALPVQLWVADFGSNITDIKADAFRDSFYDDGSRNLGFTPTHLVVRGGQNGSYADSANVQDQQTAYFGEGMTSLSFAQSGAPVTLVVPGDLATLDLSGNQGNPVGVTVYAPKGSAGWDVASAALAAIGADPAAQLKEYVPLSVTLEAGGIPEDGVYPLVAKATGGVDGDKGYRFVQVNADGTEDVLQDWSTNSTINWKAPADGGATVRVEARDATYVSADSGTYGVAAPVITSDLPTAPETVQLGGAMPTYAVEATYDGDATVSFQWYEDGRAVDGATGASFTPAPSTAGEHTYYVVVSAAKDGFTASAKSATATLKVLAGVQAPVITADLPTDQTVNAGDAVKLKVEASSPDNGTLSYQWYRDGEAVDGATGASLAVDTRDAGTHEYYVVVTNTVGSESATAQSATCTVKVNAPQIDKAALQALVDQSAALNESDYTAETWAPFAAALQAAQGVLANDQASQDDVNTALANLQTVKDALVKASQGGYDRTKLADGIYDIAVSLNQAADPDTASMAGASVNPAAQLVVKDGEYSVVVTLQTMQVMGIYGDITEVSYYPGGYVEDGQAFFQGGTDKADVLSERVADHDGKTYPATVSIPLSERMIGDGYVLSAVATTGMTGADGGPATVQAVLKLDWAAFDQQYGSHETVSKDALGGALETAKAVPSVDTLDYKLLKRAIDAAQAVYDNTKATQAQVDAQTTALSDALKVYNGTPLTDLAEGSTYTMPYQMLLDDGNGSASRKYFSEKALVKRVADGYEVTISTLAQYDTYIAGMTYAVGGQQLTAEVKDDGDGTHSYTFKVQSAVNAIAVAYQLSQANGSAVDMNIVLDTGDAELVATPEVNKADLQAQVDRVKGLQEPDYTAETWAPFAAALQAAQDVLTNKDASQADADSALRELTDAYNNLKRASGDQKADKTALAEAIAAARALDQGNKTDEAWAELQDAIKAAQAVLDDDAATQDAIDAQVIALDASVDTFKASADKPGAPGNGGDSNNQGGDNGGQGGSDDGTGGAAGTGDATDNGGSSTAGGSATNGGVSANGGTSAVGTTTGGTALTQTGDTAPIAAVAGTGLLAGAAAAIAAFFRRKKSGDQK